jgi:phosphoribosylformylglycinamidine cyclo-ligase
VLPLLADGAIKALAHITGGGLIDNLPRVLPPDVVARIDAASWQAPPVFRWLFEAGRLRPEEMLRVFNCGIGLVLVVAPEDAEPIARQLRERRETVYRLGEIAPGDGAPRVEIAPAAG